MVHRLISTICVGMMAFGSISEAKFIPMPNLNAKPLTHYDPEALERGAYVQLPDGDVIFARFVRPKDGKETITYGNGLDDSLNDMNGLDDLYINEGHGLLTFDFIGQGYTRYRTSMAKPSDLIAPISVRLGGDLSVERQIKVWYQLIQFCQIKKTVITGLSYGGGMAILLALAHPEIMDRFVLGFDPFTGPLKDQIAELNRVALGLRLIDPFMSVHDSLIAAGRTLAYTEDALAEPKILTNPDGLGVESLIAMGAALSGVDDKDTLKTLPNASLVLAGGQLDPLVKPDILIENYREAGKAGLALVDILGAPHRVTNFPGAVYDITMRALAGTYTRGAYYNYNPYEVLNKNKFTQTKTPTGAGFPPMLSGVSVSATCESLF